MNKRNLATIAITVLMAVTLSGCGILSKTSDVVLKDGTQEIIAYSNINKGDMVDLPIIDKDGFVFVGYSDGDNLYQIEYEVEKDIELEAVFEDVSDVFEYEVDQNSDDRILITEYTGDSKQLRVPQYIDGYMVSSLSSYSFEESDLVFVDLPMDVSIQSYAFQNSVDLKSVHYYGEYILPVINHIPSIEYQEILRDYDECIIIEENEVEGTWTFDTGCPIIEVLSKSESVYVNGVEYFSYYVLMDQNSISTANNFQINFYSFFGATSLESITLPKNLGYIFSEFFMECPNLKTIEVHEDSEFLSQVDGVIYSKDSTRLLYYPNNSNVSTFTIPESVEEISAGAFLYNTSIEKLIIPETYEGGFSYPGLNNLIEFEVVGNNAKYYALDGVLFSGETLVRYPSGKTDTSYRLHTGTFEIGGFAFFGNQFLEEIDFGNEIETIGRFAFQNSLNLTSLNIPSSVTVIEEYINASSAINTITLNRSFVVDGSLTYLFNRLAPYDEEVFKIYVPLDSLDDYINTSTWGRYSEYIEAIE